MENNRPENKNGSVFRSRSFKAGTYSVITCILLAVLLIVVNLIVNRLPSDMTEYDITNAQLYTITEESKKIARAVDTDVDIYLIAESGSENNTIVELLKRYTAENKKITVTYVDPAVYPNFTKQFTDEEIKENSLIMLGNGRVRILPYDSIFEYDTSSYYTTGIINTTFNGEGVVTSALDYIMKDTMPRVYNLTGHGESVLTETWKGYIQEQNLEVVDVNLLNDPDVLKDADCIIINSPTADYTPSEIEIITKYLEDHGRMLIITNWTKEKQPNLMGLMKYYGLEYVDGIVIEGNPNYCISGYQHYLVPDIIKNDITEKIVENRNYVLLPMSHGIRPSEEKRSTVTILPLLQSSTESYAKTAGNEMTTLNKEDGDIDGPFLLGAAVLEDYFSVTSKIVWFPSSYILDENADQMVSGGNSNLMLSVLSWMLDTDTAIFSVTKNVGIEALLIPNNHKVFLTVLFAVIIPVAFLGAGFVVWLIRRKK